MKKFTLGILIGFVLSFATVAAASNTIETVIFPSKFTFNGSEKSLGSEYTVLNYNGHVYVPLRFVAESMGGSVIYTPSDDPSMPNRIDTIYVSPDPTDLKIHDSNNIISVGKVTIASQPDGTRSQILGQVMLNKSENVYNSLTFKVNTYNKAGDLVTSDYVTEDPIRAGQILPFTVLTSADLQNESFDHITITDVVVKEALNK